MSKRAIVMKEQRAKSRETQRAESKERARVEAMRGESASRGNERRDAVYTAVYTTRGESATRGVGGRFRRHAGVGTRFRRHGWVLAAAHIEVLAAAHM